MSRSISELRCIPRLASVLSRPMLTGGLSQVCVWHSYQHFNRKCGNYEYCSHKPFHSLCVGHQSLLHQQGISNVLLCADNYDVLSYCQRRGKTKGNVKGKKEKKKAPEKRDVDDDEDEDPLKKFRVQLQWQCDHLKEQYLTQLGLRTTPSSYESLVVTLDKSHTVPLNQLAQVIQKSPQLIQINMDASPQYVKEVKTALMKSGLNINPQQEGTSLFITTPKVTREHRENLAKNAQKLFNDTKEKMVGFQAKQLKTAKRNDDKNLDAEIRKLYQEYLKKAESMMTKKQKDLTG
ncbi:ribosome-recycling factor, mitochondrial-like [Ylistrum balloti]|uniref:ribosome-recycling factor, mitochondrial-like n=1 Tax=Ylistrum balloti TaxID=509963 RepID=UPI002905B386|nr:ribosome-recycling factor, mitochondrial-like [Ylistrum balloti]